MARLEVPLLSKVLRATGDVLLRAELDLLVRTNSFIWEKMVFLVDTGTEMTSIPIAAARRLDLPFPQKPVPRLHFQSTGEEVRAGIIRAQIVGLGTREFAFSCYFVGNPSAMASSGSSPRLRRNLLGLTSVVDKVRITFDGEVTPQAPYGIMILEEK
jgi:hypothetical protein